METTLVKISKDKRKPYYLVPAHHAFVNGEKLYLCDGCCFYTNKAGCNIPEGNRLLCMAHNRADCKGKIYREAT